MMRLEPKLTAPALLFGTLIHAALEFYYKPGKVRGPHPAGIFDRLFQDYAQGMYAMGFKDDTDVWYEARDLGNHMLEEYVKHYGSDDEWEVIHPELDFTAPIRNESGKVVAHYVGVIDLVMRHRPTGKISLWDHKTAKSIETDYLRLDDQSSGYWTYGVDRLRKAGIIKPGQDLDMIWFNFLRKGKADARPRNALGQYLNQPTKAELKEFGPNYPGSPSKNQPAPLFLRHPSFRSENDRQLTRERTLEELREIKMVKAGRLPVIKSPSKFNCRMCGVRDICELHESGDDWKEAARMLMVPSKNRQKLEAITYEKEH
jgi:hypothetical protein